MQLFKWGRELDQTLDVRFASAPVVRGSRVALTFRDRIGSPCWTLKGFGSAGLAPREDDQWRIRALFETPDSQMGNTCHEPMIILP